MKDVYKVRAALLVEPSGMPDWLAEAIRGAQAQGVEIPLILCCRNTFIQRRPVRHFLYYALNLIVMRRGPEERLRPLADLGLGGAEQFVFEAEASNRAGWQRIPSSVGHKVREHKCDLVIKAGMGLVENPDDSGAPLGMLSYHHGDPSRYRGRPAGFWEIMEGASTMGMMVQRISNRLDAGAVLAFGRSKVYPYSYRQTLAQVRKSSAALLAKAIHAARIGLQVDISTTGKNYRLPSNLQVCGFVFKILRAKIARLAYGAFIQKNWCIGTGEAAKVFEGEVSLPPPVPIATPPGYIFLADCFWANDGGIYAEAMRSGAGIAEIVHLSPSGTTVISDQASRHWSYPFPFDWEGAECLLPEVADWSSPFILKASSKSDQRYYLKGVERLRLIDPTLVSHQGHWYLFASQSPLPNDQLSLWFSSAGPDGPFQPHPQSPIVVDVTCARMAGPLLREKGALIRLGQDFSEGYGSAISICAISELSPEVYTERKVGRMRLAGQKGPHTYAVRNNRAVFDWYKESFSVFAGLRRLVSKFAKR